MVLLGDGVRAGEMAALCREVASSNGLAFWAAWGKVMRGAAAVLAGRGQEGVATMRRAREEYPHMGVAEQLNLLARLAEGHLRLGQLEEAEACLDEAFAVAERITTHVWRAELHRLRGVLAARRGAAPDDWAGEFDRSAALALGHGASSLVLRAALSRYEAARSGDAEELERRAREELATVYASFAQGRDTSDLRRAAELLGGQ